VIALVNSRFLASCTSVGSSAKVVIVIGFVQCSAWVHREYQT